MVDPSALLGPMNYSVPGIYYHSIDNLGMLTPVGLILNFVGAIVLLGSDVKSIKQVLERVDPVHYAYKSGLSRIISKSMVDDEKNDNRAHPYDIPVSADHWSLWPLTQFLERHAEQDIPRDAEIDIRGGWFKVNGEQLMFSEERLVQSNEKRRLQTDLRLSLGAAFDLLYEARIRRIYIYGVGLLALGFLLQLIDSLV